MGHTEGPWSVRHTSISWWIEAPRDRSRFISGPIPADVWHHEKEQRDNCEALQNARLVAAAPDLLRALQHILDGALSLPRFAEEEARAAIARATPNALRAEQESGK